MFCQSTPLKNGWAFISSMLPSLLSGSQHHLIRQKVLSTWIQITKLGNITGSHKQLITCPDCCYSWYVKLWQWYMQHIYYTHLSIKSLALSEMGISGGKIRVSLQFITFLYVSEKWKIWIVCSSVNQVEINFSELNRPLDLELACVCATQDRQNT